MNHEALAGMAPERAAFERWFRGRSDHYEFVRRLDRALMFGAAGAKEAESRYHEDATQGAWEAWQGAVAAERERCAPLVQAVEWLLNDGHMNQEHLARLRAAYERA